MCPALLLLTVLTAQPAAIPHSPTVAIPLRLSNDGLPLVRVEVSERRSAWFVLDTGASGSTVLDRLADELDLRPVGRSAISTATGNSAVDLVRIPSLRLTGAPVAFSLTAARDALKLVRQVAPEAEGILGQDVLATTDYLIDLAARRLVIGTFDPPKGGHTVGLRWSAGRPVLLFEQDRSTVGLVLDTGADALFVAPAAAGKIVGAEPPTTRAVALLQTVNGRRSVEVEHHRSLRLAGVPLGAVTVVRLPGDDSSMSPDVGLLPGALFSRMYISARRGDATVWPR